MKAVIAGGGIGGLTAALCFARRGWEVEVVEQAAEWSDVGAGIQLSPNAMHVMRWLGCEPHLLQSACEPQATALRHYRTGRPLLTVPMGELYERRYGAKYLHLHRADLIDALATSLTTALRADTGGKARLRLGEVAQSYSQDDSSVSLQCHSGLALEADLLVGADGLNSVIRGCLQEATAEQSLPRYTGCVAWRGLVQTEAVSAEHRPERMTNAWLGPGRHFVAYYLRGGELINFVAVQEQQAEVSQSWSRADTADAPRRAFAGWHPVVGAVLAACEECSLWGLYDHRPLPRWSDGRTVLLGDACHAMLPFQAQGGAMAIEDGYVLAARCADSGDGNSLSAALAEYEAQRKPRASRLQAISRRNAALYHARGTSQLFKCRLQFALARLMPAAARRRLDAIYGFDVTSDEERRD